MTDNTFTLYNGDCIEQLKQMDDNSIDAIVTDPPYGLSKTPDMKEVLKHWMNGDDYTHKGKGFMGKSWDSFVPGPSVWQECLRVLKPGGHLLCFFGSRTYDLGTLAIRLAGFEIRDQIMWVYGSGFPKSQNISKAIDKKKGAEREVISVDDYRKNRNKNGRKVNNSGCYGKDKRSNEDFKITKPSTDEAKQYDGFWTALKPAHEPLVLARKPVSNSIVDNVLEYGTGALNIDGCRVAANGEKTGGNGYWGMQDKKGWNKNSVPYKSKSNQTTNKGRFPANLIHDNSEEVRELFPDSKSCNSPSDAKPSSKYRPNQPNYQPQGKIYPGDEGSAARFFYSPKASKKDRNEGLDEFINLHPTVKPTDLMAYLVRLITPPDGIVLDPFMGSGTTGKAAIREGFDFIGIELDTEYHKIAKARIENERAKIDAKNKHSELIEW